jgi:hypothetical protein
MMATLARREIRMEITIQRAPESVRRWWTEYPDDYVATDPREQPFRIRTLDRKDGKRHVMTTWKRPDGSIAEWEEFLEIFPDGSWTYTIPRNVGNYRIFDRFLPRPGAEGGTVLRIESDVEALTPEAVAGIEAQAVRMEAGWRAIVPLCERDAP